MLKTLAAMKKVIPMLKLILGENFDREHWMCLFKILDIKDKKIENLLFGDLLNKYLILQR